MNKLQQGYFTIRGWKNFLKKVKRHTNRRRVVAGIYKHERNMRLHAEKQGRLYRHTEIHIPYHEHKPPYPEIIRFLASITDVFGNKGYNRKDDGVFEMPECFSLIDNYKESFNFLRRLFVVLYKGRTKKIVLDYKNCKRIDVDASICMDVILAEFISYNNNCVKKGFRQVYPHTIQPINVSDPNVTKVLFSIGAYRNLKGFTVRFDDVEPLPVLINHLKGPEIWRRSELHLTKIVEYIKTCLKKLGHELTIDAESEFYKVIGEVMSNAEEHSTVSYRYAIGFFQETHEHDEHFGIFNFSIFNFGDTIYQTFKSPGCKNPKVVQQMEELSVDYTSKGWFNRSEFEEETLWSLYAMQEGVTSKEKKRGNGSIQYIDNFFKLRGGTENDNLSQMVVISGNTRILFEGTYPIVNKEVVGRNKPFRVITFNETGRIEDKPDKKYVTFAPHYFPGTIISARILIKDNNINSYPHAK